MTCVTNTWPVLRSQLTLLSSPGPVTQWRKHLHWNHVSSCTARNYLFFPSELTQKPNTLNTLILSWLLGEVPWGVLWQAAVFVRLLRMQSCVSRWKVTLSEEGRQLDSCNNEYYLLPFQQKCTLQWCCTNINHTSILEHRFLHLLVKVYFICTSYI